MSPGGPGRGAPTTNPFDDRAVAERYEQWYFSHGRRADRLETRLLKQLLADFPDATTVLDVGCGTGHFTRWMASRGLSVVGLDISEAMLAEARKWNGLRYVAGDAEDLPFDDREFDVATMMTTLEFLPDPQVALKELVRVADRGIILGVLNRTSLLAVRRRRSGKPPWNAARFFAPNELARAVTAAAGERFRSMRWRTTLWPLPIFGSLPLPWGAFIGLAAKLNDGGLGMTATTKKGGGTC